MSVRNIKRSNGPTFGEVVDRVRLESNLLELVKFMHDIFVRLNSSQQRY
jgi:hypothetical protein